MTDFLTLSPHSDVDKADLENVLYDIEIKKKEKLGYTRGRAVALGDGYFLTAYHVVNPNDIGNNELVLLPQSRRGYLIDFSKEFKILSHDEKADIALIKVPVEEPKGKALVHLSSQVPEVNQAVSRFDRLTGRPKQTAYEFEVVGKDYYDEKKDINLGKIILPADSLLFENQAWVLPFDRDYIIKNSKGRDPIPQQDGSFSSLLSYNGDSGAPVFVRLKNGEYRFAGIVTSVWQILHYIETPGHPLRYARMSQTGTIFANRSPIESLVKSYLRIL